MSKIKKKEELEFAKTVIGGIYGVAGAGKSTLALSAPAPLFIDTDKGIHRVQAQYRSDSVPVQSYQDILDVLNEDLSDYQTIIIDTLGELVTFMLDYFVQKDKTLITRAGTYNRAVWGLVKTEFKNLKLKLQKLNKHLIFVAHQQKDGYDEDAKVTLECAGSTGKEVIRMLDFLGYVEIIGNRRSISFEPSPRFYAKNSLELEEYLPLPDLKKGEPNDFIDRVIIKPTLAKRKGECKKAKESYVSLKEARQLISTMDNPNDILTEFKKLNLALYNKKVLLQELIDHFKNYNFEPQSGEFVVCQ